MKKIPKRFISIILSLMLAIFSCSCSTPQENTPQKYELDESFCQMGEELESFTVAICGKVLPFPLSYSDFIKSGFSLLPSLEKQTLNAGQYSLFEVVSGEIKLEAYFANFRKDTAQLTDCTVCGIYADTSFGGGIALPKNIELGFSHLEDARKAFGKSENISVQNNQDEEIKTYEYLLSDKSVYKLSFSEDVLIAIEFYKIDNPDYFNASDEEPDCIDDYKDPEELSDKIEDFTFYLYGTTYTMPLPVKRLIKGGFVNVGSSDKFILPNETLPDAIKLTRSNRTLTLSVKNFADYPTVAENCFVSSIESKSSVKLDLTLAGGCRVGSTQSNFEAVFPKKSFSSIKKKGKKTIYIYDNDEKGRITVTCSEGYISSIKIQSN